MSGRRIAQVLGTSAGGIGTHVASATRELLARGDRVTVYGPAATNDRFGFRDTGARFVPIEIPTAAEPVAHARAVAVLRKTLVGASGAKPDVVHAHGLRAGLTSVASKGSGVPLVVSWHVDHSSSTSKMVNAAKKSVARCAEVSLCTDKNQMQHMYTLGGKDVRYAPIAAPALPKPRKDADAVKHDLGVDGPLVLAVGRLHEVKRFDVLMDAAEILAHRENAPTVVIAGDGPLGGQLEARTRGCAADVRLLGHRTDIAELLTAADVAVVTSDSETRQFFAQEALFAGTPLVATRVGGIPDLVQDAAVLVEPGDSNGVADAITRVLTQETLRDELAEAAKKQTASWPTETDTIDHLDALYRELTGR